MSSELHIKCIIKYNKKRIINIIHKLQSHILQ
jgi:hypothetical protein